MTSSRKPRMSVLGVLSACLALALVSDGTTAQDLSAQERSIQDNVLRNNEEAIVFLERVVNINSGTQNADGVREVGWVFAQELEELGFATQWVGMPRDILRGGHLFATREGTRGRRLLLIGHLDTVFEKDSPFQNFEQRGDSAFGPGVVDMKGGDVVLLYALRALFEAGALDETTITVALIGDEEDPGGEIAIVRQALFEAAGRSNVALGFEGSVGPNNATTARRGSSTWLLEVTGRRGHSGQIFSEEYGSGAIFEAARILNMFRESVVGTEYLTFNAGVILGGTAVNYDETASRGDVFGKTNVIPQTVTVHGGLRFLTEDEKDWTRAVMHVVVGENLPHTTARIRFWDGYPAMSPKPGNDSLLALYDSVSQDLGYGPITALDPRARGAADISFVADRLDALSGLGPLGGGAHSVDEFLDLRSLPVATSRAAILIYRLTR